MVTGISREETTEAFGDQDFTEDNFEAFAQQIDPSLTEYQATATFDNLVADGIDSFDAAFTALDTDGDLTVTSQEVKDGCGTCQHDGVSADGIVGDGTSSEVLSQQMDDISGTGVALTDEKDTIIAEYEAENSDVFESLSEGDIAYLKEVNIFSGQSTETDEAGNPIGYNEAAKEAFRLIVDMYANDSDFRDLLQFYIDKKGEGPTITMGELDSGDSNTELFGLGSVDGTESVIDSTNVTSTDPADKLRAQETIAHELMHNLGLGHDTEEEEASFDTELGSMFDMEDEGGSDSYEWHNYSTDKENDMPLLTETTEEDA